ncbi:protein-glutamine gamma-glutamyltransferase [Halobacillus mangrovi]|uniref:Protein-glutamine gamma-glutamyltransferase n=1 Tax=Halobacillus mangrovi TaxID=402384 RepID=A0A1W5ZSG3_9BACI|nr:protein-glutamine gamma-glutamyltransferase [Halobacillus mangrovi]ARI76238.1 protein-glutamine gamma-glutamyltransferase [Halobacillus mangrovi]
MIQVSGRPFPLPASWDLNETEKMIFQSLQDAPGLYSYPSGRGLYFEIKFRKNIIDSAREMKASEAIFSSFLRSRCNDQYWEKTNAGGFLLKANVNPADAILDIYQNGALYAFECATACVIVLYHATIKSMGKTFFNTYFQNLYLYSWHTDDDLKIHTFYGDHFLPGDIIYFNNPDFSPTTPWFRGVNAVVLGNDQFFGHGFVIKNADEMIETLNRKRKPDSDKSAYLTNLVTRPVFSQLGNSSTLQSGRYTQPVIHHNKNSLCRAHYLIYLRQYLNQ